MNDLGHRLTEKELQKLERRIAALYKEARDSLDETVKAYFESFRKRDEAQKAKLDAGEITKEQYTQWRLNQIGRGERFKALRETMAERYTKANEVAVAYVNDETPGIYSLNRNYAAYTIEKTGADVSFTLFDEQTVKRLMVEAPELMPYYPPTRALKRGIDLKYGKKQITASVTSGILQGKSIGKIANDLQGRIETMNRASAIRTARTAVTGAQNAGRMDTYVQAEKMGIKMEREWLATLDNRTRHAHAVLDGQRRPINKPFQVDGQEIMFPGDTKAKPYLVYNCRCTLVAAVKSVDTSDAKRRAREPETGKSKVVANMTYAEWSGWKQEKTAVDNRTTGEKIANIFGVDLSKVQIDNLPQEAQNSIYGAIQRVFEKFPQIKGHTQTLYYSDDMGDATAASLSITGVLKASRKFLDFEKLKKQYDYDVKLKWNPKGTTADSVFVHEMGHQIDGYLTKNKRCGGEIGQYGVVRTSVEIQKEVLARLGLTDERLREIRKEYAAQGYSGKDLTHAVQFERKEFIIKNISEYAAENSNEFFAECFAEYIDSPEPRDAAKIFGEILEREMEAIR